MKHIKYIPKTFFIFIFPLLSFGQGKTASFIKAVPYKAFDDIKDSVIAHPVFFFKNKELTNNVNKTGKADYYPYYEKDQTLSIKAVIKSLASEGLSELSYEEIKNDNIFFSFVIHHEWIAAYRSYHRL